MVEIVQDIQDKEKEVYIYTYTERVGMKHVQLQTR